MNITPVPAILPVDFYVYEHRKATTGEVFYVGKGVGRRAWRHGQSKRSDWWMRVAAKHGVIVSIVIDGLQDWAAAEIEQDLIALHGRKDRGYGLLINGTDGGDGMAGQIQSDETKAKRSASVAQAFADPVIRAKLIQATSGVEFRLARGNATKNWWTADRRAQRAEQTRQRWSNEDFKRAMSAKNKDAAKTRKTTGRPVFCIETGMHFPSAMAAVYWLHQNGRTKAQNGPILNCCNGHQRYNTAYGYTWRYA